MLHQYSKNIVFLDNASANSSTYTSAWHFVGDYAQMSLSWITGAAVASRLTVQGSNAEGFDTAIAGLSTLSDIGEQGHYAFTPGARWMRCLRSALDSRSSVILQART